MAAAPYVADCVTLWQAYANANIPGLDAFKITKPIAAVATNDLDSVKQVLASGGALAYGTRLYTDWIDYQGTPSPYVGNGTLSRKPGTYKPAGHCMLIVGYDDTLGAVRIQNSHGTDWGSNGLLWMGYETFQTLAQGQALYVQM
jgi:C1A family cysteine protease